MTKTFDTSSQYGTPPAANDNRPEHPEFFTVNSGKDPYASHDLQKTDLIRSQAPPIRLRLGGLVVAASNAGGPSPRIAQTGRDIRVRSKVRRQVDDRGVLDIRPQLDRGPSLQSRAMDPGSAFRRGQSRGIGARLQGRSVEALRKYDATEECGVPTGPELIEGTVRLSRRHVGRDSSISRLPPVVGRRMQHEDVRRQDGTSRCPKVTVRHSAEVEPPSFRAVLYASSSVADGSADRQLAELAELAARKGFTFVECHVDEGGDRNSRRAGWRAVMRAVRRGDADIVLVTEMRGVTYSMSEGFEILEELERRGVRLCCRDCPEDWSKDWLLLAATGFVSAEAAAAAAVPLE